MRQRFRETAHLVCVPLLVAIGEVPGAGLFSVKQRRLVPDSIRVVGALVRSVVVVVVESAVVVERFGEGVDSADAERRAGRDGRESTGPSEKVPAICGGRRRIMAGLFRVWISRKPTKLLHTDSRGAHQPAGKLAEPSVTDARNPGDLCAYGDSSAVNGVCGAAGRGHPLRGLTARRPRLGVGAASRRDRLMEAVYQSGGGGRLQSAARTARAHVAADARGSSPLADQNAPRRTRSLQAARCQLARGRFRWTARERGKTAKWSG